MISGEFFAAITEVILFYASGEINANQCCAGIMEVKMSTNKRQCCATRLKGGAGRSLLRLATSLGWRATIGMDSTKGEIIEQIGENQFQT